jgi:CDGSH-type Zn-finger protein
MSLESRLCVSFRIVTARFSKRYPSTEKTKRAITKCTEITGQLRQPQDHVVAGRINLTLCHSYLKPYCKGRNPAFFFSGRLIYTLQQQRFRAFRLAQDIQIPSVLERYRRQRVNRKHPVTALGIEPKNFWLVAQCLNAQHHREIVRGCLIFG